jgi:hypothetical protein
MLGFMKGLRKWGEKERKSESRGDCNWVYRKVSAATRK